MIEFVCDSCSAVRQDDEPWILGIAAEAVDVTAARRELTLFPVWDRGRSVHPLAVHFCSVECKDKYMERLFGPDATAEEVVVERAAPVQAVVQRVKPTTERLPKRGVARRRSPQKKSA